MEDGGPAFPVVPQSVKDPTLEYGMSLRDFFAAAALQGIIASRKTMASVGEVGAGKCGGAFEACAAYVWADAMLAEREKS